MERINIMTSCNDGIAQYILPQIASIGVNLGNYQVEFFLVHNQISPEKVNLIRDYSKFFANITFNEIIIDNIVPYEKLLINNGHWPCEAFFSLCCHEYLPDDVDRILYIDAADVIIDDDISEYYFGDFEGCSIIATALRYAEDSSGNLRLFTKEDLSHKQLLETIRIGVFNSGSYVINVAKFRENKLTMDDFIYLSNVMQDHFHPEEGDIVAYNGDQALLSIAFLGDIKFLGYPETKDIFYMPYNFLLSFYNVKNNLWYKPKILHYAGSGLEKPWRARFSIDEVYKYGFQKDTSRLRASFHLKGQQIELFEIWWLYCEMTPLYEELNKEARIYAQTLETHYLPLCKLYNNLADSISQRKEG